MLTPKRTFPEKHKVVKVKETPQTNNHPFFIKEYGYCKEKKFVVGEDKEINDILVLYSVSGYARFSRYKDTYYINDNMVIISACNVPLIFNKVSKEWEFFYMIIAGSHAKLYYNLIRDKSNIIPVNPLSYNALDWFIELYKVPMDNTVYSQMTVSMLIHNILYSLYEASYSIIQSKKIIPAKESDINIVLNYIAENYKKDLTVDEICEQVHFSKYYFCKLFKEHTGISLYQYINEYRVNKSKELLTYSKMSVKSIAEAVGFKNTLTYIRWFEKSMNMTPSEYRQNF